MGGGDAVDEEKQILCCALCCVHMGLYPTCDSLGCSGKAGLCCLNCEYCCKVRRFLVLIYTRLNTSNTFVHLPSRARLPSSAPSQSYVAGCIIQQPGAPCLPCCCCGPQIECDGCSVFNVQGQCCCCVTSAAFPCNDEVPCILNVAGCTLYPKCTCFAPMSEIMRR